jgi:hypothetical protein
MEYSFLTTAIENLNLNGVYYTPEIIKNKIQMEKINTIIANPPFKIKNVKKSVVYVEFLDCKNKYIQTRKDFETYENAWKWVCKTFDNPSKDFIKYY